MALPDYIEGWYGEELLLIVHLTDQSNTKLFKVNPTLASGDAKCITRLNGSWGSRANLGTLPAVVDASGSAVLVIVSAAEMTGDLVVVELRDAAGDQWCDVGITIVPRKPAGSTLVRTTIATLASQTSFTLTGGSADNDAYNGLPIVVEDASTLVQRCVGVVSDYVGSTKTVTLAADPGVFEMAVGDRVFIVASSTAATVRTTVQSDGVKLANIAHGGNAASLTLAGTSGPALSLTGGMGFAGLTIDGSLTHGVIITSGGSTADSVRLASGANAYGINETTGLAAIKGALSALTIDTHAEPGQGAPAATLSLAAKINYLFKAWRNKKTQTATQFSLYDDAGTTIDQKATVSDSSGTTTVGEIASGP